MLSLSLFHCWTLASPKCRYSNGFCASRIFVAIEINFYSLPRLLNRKEHRSQLGQPPSIDGSDAVHVLLSGHHELVVDHIVRRVAEPEQRGRGVQVARHARATVHVLADAFEARGLLEVRWGDGTVRLFLWDKHRDIKWVKEIFFRQFLSSRPE